MALSLAPFISVGALNSCYKMVNCEFIFTFSSQAESVMNSALLYLMSGKSNNSCVDKISTGPRTHSEYQKGSLMQEEDSKSTSRQAIKLAQVYCSNRICPW